MSVSDQHAAGPLRTALRDSLHSVPPLHSRSPTASPKRQDGLLDFLNACHDAQSLSSGHLFGKPRQNETILRPSTPETNRRHATGRISKMPRTADGPRPQHVSRPSRSGKAQRLRARLPAANRDGSRSDTERTADGPRPQHVGPLRRTAKTRSFCAWPSAANRDGSRSVGGSPKKFSVLGPISRWPSAEKTFKL